MCEDLICDDLGSGLVQLTFNRPPANALSSALLGSLVDTIRRLAQRIAPPGIVLTGQGDRFFSAGGDVKEFAEAALVSSRMSDFHAVLCELDRYPRPVVCAVRGYAVGGAFELVLFCDYAVASSHSKFGFPEINHGLLPAAKGIRQAVVRLGHRAAKSILFSGGLFSAADALAMTAIDQVVENDQVLQTAIAVCRDLAGKDPRLLAALKHSIHHTSTMNDDELHQLSLSDLHGYLADPASIELRSRFMQRRARL